MGTLELAARCAPESVPGSSGCCRTGPPRGAGVGAPCRGWEWPGRGGRSPGSRSDSACPFSCSPSVTRMVSGPRVGGPGGGGCPIPGSRRCRALARGSGSVACCAHPPRDPAGTRGRFVPELAAPAAGTAPLAPKRWRCARRPQPPSSLTPPPHGWGAPPGVPCPVPAPPCLSHVPRAQPGSFHKPAACQTRDSPVTAP